MIPVYQPIVHTSVTEPGDWQQQLAGAIRSTTALLDALDLPVDHSRALEPGAKDFPIRVPKAFLAKMRPGDWHDPLLRQVLALPQEAEPMPGFSTDPLEEAAASPAQGIVHKYQGRALLITTQACAVHCRYCFRRHFPYQEHRQPQWREALEYLKQQPDIQEIILSGGDPLSLNDKTFATLVQQLEAIPHITTLRIHSRFPIVIPARLNQALEQTLSRTRLQVVLVLHANHGNEIDEELSDRLRALQRLGITLLNQSVLLAGVNDDAESLMDLSQRLFAAGVLPYYLHDLDPVQGAHHFQVAPERAAQLQRQLLARLPGYLVPKWVREIPGEPNKTPL